MSWPVAFAVGMFTAFFLLFLFDLRLWRTARKARNPFKNAIARRLAMGPCVVAVGGGTGLSTLLKGLKKFTQNITAVVAVTDEGGSSGRLRTEWGVLPPGDVRNCIVALAENDNELRRLLDFRFDRGELAGHSLGNLLLLAVSELCGDFSVAVEQINHLLAIRGKVLPVTTETITLAGTAEGRTVRGELEISRNGRALEGIWLEPEGARPLPEVLQAAEEADLIVLGPGSLFTSVIPNLLLPDFARALREASAPKVYVCNLMTQPEETEGMDIVRHVEWVSAALGSVPDIVVINSEPIPDALAARYRLQGAEALLLDSRHGQRKKLERMGCAILELPMLGILDAAAANAVAANAMTANAMTANAMTANAVVRHDSAKLAERLFRLCREPEVRGKAKKQRRRS
jgi:uncharacterized cofD-like protein